MSANIDNNVAQSSRELQLRRELEVLRCRVVVTEALADALMWVACLFHSEGKGRRPCAGVVSAPRTRTTENYWRQPLTWNATALARGERARVFAASPTRNREVTDAATRLLAGMKPLTPVTSPALRHSLTTSARGPARSAHESLTPGSNQNTLEPS